MAVPPNRIPVRLARGLKSALTTNVGDLLEGELLYAKDEDRLYTIENGALVSIKADITSSSIDELNDVDTSTVAPVIGQKLTWNGSNWVPDFTGRISDSGSAVSGELVLTGLGSSGIIWKVGSDLDAWIVVYGSAADRTADALRSYGTDPVPGSGVQGEWYVTGGTTVLATPAPTYFNNDTNETNAIYLAVKDQVGSPVNATVTVYAYV